MRIHLSTVVIAKAKSTLAVKTVGPEATKVDISLTELSMGDNQPSTEDGLSEHIEDGVGNNLAIDTDTASAISEAPNTECC